MLWLPLDLRSLRSYYCDVSGSNQIGLIFPNHSGRNLYAALVWRCMHKGLELFYYLNLKDRTLPPLPSSTLLAFPFEGAKKMSPPAANSNSLSSEFY